VPINKIVLPKQSTVQDTSTKQTYESSDDYSGTDGKSVFSETKTNFEVKINYNSCMIEDFFVICQYGRPRLLYFSRKFIDLRHWVIM